MPLQCSDSMFIKYNPWQKSSDFNSGANERIIRMVEMHVDPPKFKRKRVPKAYGSPPVALMHSPPRPVNLPPCVSNWNNPKGYTIPLDKRLAADGRLLEEGQINDNFAKLSESLNVSEEKAREAVAMRSKVQKEMMMKEEERKAMDLRALAQRARSDVSIETKEEREREKIRKERKRKRDGEETRGKKSKILSDKDRDISEKVALGMASVSSGRGGEVMYDQRLFNQEKGIDTGFATDDQYNVYDKGLFTSQTTLYRPKRDTDSDMYGGAVEQLDKIMKTDRPVEFEKEAEEADPFGLDQFLTKVKTGKK